jgi:hypothetical protein
VYRKIVARMLKVMEKNCVDKGKPSCEPMEKALPKRVGIDGITVVGCSRLPWREAFETSQLPWMELVGEYSHCRSMTALVAQSERPCVGTKKRGMVLATALFLHVCP